MPMGYYSSMGYYFFNVSLPWVIIRAWVTIIRAWVTIRRYKVHVHMSIFNSFSLQASTTKVAFTILLTENFTISMRKCLNATIILFEAIKVLVSQQILFTTMEVEWYTRIYLLKTGIKKCMYAHIPCLDIVHIFVEIKRYSSIYRNMVHIKPAT